MEIVIAVLSWVVPILIGLLVASVPASLILEKVKKDWKGSKGAKIYSIVQASSIVVWIIALGILLVLILG